MNFPLQTFLLAAAAATSVPQQIVPNPGIVATLSSANPLTLGQPMLFDVTLTNNSTTTVVGQFQQVGLQVVAVSPGTLPSPYPCLAPSGIFGTGQYPQTSNGAPSSGLAGVYVNLAPGKSVSIPAHADLRCYANITTAGTYTISAELAILWYTQSGVLEELIFDANQDVVTINS